jgi:hypothetical protein
MIRRGGALPDEGVNPVPELFPDRIEAGVLLVAHHVDELVRISDGPGKAVGEGDQPTAPELSGTRTRIAVWWVVECRRNR